jgi:hypothetical protein
MERVQRYILQQQSDHVHEDFGKEGEGECLDYGWWQAHLMIIKHTFYEIFF